MHVSLFETPNRIFMVAAPAERGVGTRSATFLQIFNALFVVRLAIAKLRDLVHLRRNAGASIPMTARYCDDCLRPLTISDARLESRAGAANAVPICLSTSQSVIISSCHSDLGWR